MSAENGRVGWWSDRLGWPKISSTLAAHRVPLNSFVFYLGGSTLFLMLTQVGSGVLLLLYYQPDAALAYASTERISGEIPYGTLIRNVHVWASDLFVASLLAHVFAILVRRTYRPPHELTWLSGVVLLVLGLGLAFTGTILPWSENAYTQAGVGSELASFVPVIGGWLRGFMRGGDEVTSSTLGHAFGFHVAALPAMVTTLVASHLFFLSRKSHRLAANAVCPPSAETIPLYPDGLVRLAAALVGIFVVIMTLAIYFERPLGAAADPRMPSPAGARPPWYFLPFHQLVLLSPKELLGMDGARFIVGIACLIGIVFVALPFLDRRGSRVVAFAACALLVVCLFLAATSALG